VYLLQDDANQHAQKCQLVIFSKLGDEGNDARRIFINKTASSKMAVPSSSCFCG
jgi:hypothetical protein